MKTFRWFASHNNTNTPKSQNSNSLHTEIVISAYLIATLGLALVACSKAKSNPTASSAPIAPVTAPLPTAPAPVVAEAVPPAPPVAKKKAVRHRPANVTYKNDIYGVSFQYPRRYSLKTGDEAIVDWFGSQPMGMNFVQSGGVAVAAVELPRGSFPGTDYHDAFFTISVNRQLSEAQCSQFSAVEEQSPDDESVAPRTVNIGGQDFAETSTFNGKSTEQAYARYYHRYDNGVCYEVALGVETAGYGVVDGITAVDRDDVFGKLEPMLASVKIETAAKPAPDSSVAAATPAPPQETASESIH
jgi:hypothetical protein